MSIKRFLKETKKGVETKILGVILYHRGLSYRDTSKILGVIEPGSYEAVHYWYKQFHKLFANWTLKNLQFPLGKLPCRLKSPFNKNIIFKLNTFCPRRLCP